MKAARVIRRGLLYIGLAFAGLAVCALLVAFSIRTGIDLTGGWLALIVFTAGLFWVTIRQSRQYWRHPGFWFVIAGLLALHLLAFAAILRVYPKWRGIWFVPITIFEGGLFGGILFLLFGTPKGPSASTRSP